MKAITGKKYEHQIVCQYCGRLGRRQVVGEEFRHQFTEMLGA